MGSTSLYAADAAAKADDDSEVITVTGSRIKRANLSSSSPVLQVDGEDFAIHGITKVEDLLNDLPQVFPGQTSGIANGATGTATVDLRFLGAQRTLTLVNGRRLPTGSPIGGGAGADINQIPAALIDRVELLTGGASSTYGSDAVAGVVNFIMKDNFEGVEFSYQYSFYQHNNDRSGIQQIVTDAGFPAANGSVSDGDTHDFSLIIGANTADGRGNVTAYATSRNVQAITQEARDYSSCALGLSGGALSCRGSSTIPDTRVTDFAGGFDFQVSGNEFVPFNSLYNYGPLNHFQRPDKRRTLGAFANYEISKNVEVYAELSLMDDRSDAQIAPSGAFFVTNTIACNNPFLSAQQFQQLCGQFGLAPTDIQTAYIGRRNVEGGPRDDDLRHTSYRGVFGFRGEINENWSYDTFFNYGTVIQSQVYQNDLSITKLTRALNAVRDANGNIVCQSVVDGSDPNCVPYNVFQTGGVTQDQVNYLVLPLFEQGETISTQWVGYVTGDLTDTGFKMPGTEQGAQVVLGFERRTEDLVFNPDQGFSSGDGAGQGGATTGVKGNLNVREIFAEFSMPLFQDTEFANYLNLDLGYRYSDYSTGKTTNTYKIAMDWEVNDMVKVRGSYQSASRHANIRELFVPQSIGLFNLDEDPCAGATPTFSLEQCQRTGVTAARYGTIADSPAGQYNGLFGGNPDLDPEDSETYSFGIILNPVDDLDIALDYFNIDVTKAIGTVPADVILRKCGEDNVQSFCDLIHRGPTETLWIGADFTEQTNINTGSLSVEGIDFDTTYKFDLQDMGDLNFALKGTYLLTWDTEPVKGEGVTSCLGFWDRNTCGNPTPEWRWNLATTWNTPWDINVTGTIRYLGETKELGDGPTPINAQTYLDLSASWDMNESVKFRFGIDNILDKNTPIIPNAPAGIGNGNTFPGSFDYLGRYVFASVTYSL
ncbi:MAG TPA: TonB-dependent receptor [Aeromonadales bacterium]|nr:TonB-dependent receptor [Aeromonadales bacterium]